MTAVALALVLLTGAASQKSSGRKAKTAQPSKKSACADLMTQGAMNRCAEDEYRKADAELNRIYPQVMAKLSSEHKQKLKAAQLAWIQFRDAHCDCQAFTFDGGTMQPLIKFSCLESETNARIKQLKLLAEDASR